MLSPRRPALVDAVDVPRTSLSFHASRGLPVALPELQGNRTDRHLGNTRMTESDSRQVGGREELAFRAPGRSSRRPTTKLARAVSDGPAHRCPPAAGPRESTTQVEAEYLTHRRRLSRGKVVLPSPCDGNTGSGRFCAVRVNPSSQGQQVTGASMGDLANYADLLRTPGGLPGHVHSPPARLASFARHQIHDHAGHALGSDQARARCDPAQAGHGSIDQAGADSPHASFRGRCTFICRMSFRGRCTFICRITQAIPSTPPAAPAPSGRPGRPILGED